MRATLSFAALPDIAFKDIPQYGRAGSLSGTVTGASPAEHRVVVLLRLPSGWHSKPDCNAPFTEIDAEGNWVADISTTTLDKFATEITALLLPVHFVPPCVQGDASIPQNITSQAVASATVTRFDPAFRRIQFAGYDWWVKRSTTLVGPGPNYFSDSTNNVWVDDSGQLHLRISRNGNRWECAEIVSVRSFGHGTYRFEVTGNVDQLDPNAVVGLFTWSDNPAYAHREIDIEFSRWGNPSDTNNAQFVVQPWDLPGNLVRYRVSPEVMHSTHLFRWEPNRVLFSAQKGAYSPATAGTNVLKQWAYTFGVPPEGDENVRLNLWLFNGRAPATGAPVDIVIPSFRYVPPGPVGEPALTNAAIFNSQFHFDLRTEADRSYGIEASSDLLNWTTRVSVLASNLGFSIREPLLSSQNEFFRVKVLP